MSVPLDVGRKLHTKSGPWGCRRSYVRAVKSPRGRSGCSSCGRRGVVRARLSIWAAPTTTPRSKPSRLARIVEPTSKADSLRVLAEIGAAAIDYRTVTRRLPVIAKPQVRQALSSACAAIAGLGPASPVL